MYCCYCWLYPVHTSCTQHYTHTVFLASHTTLFSTQISNTKTTLSTQKNNKTFSAHHMLLRTVPMISYRLPKGLGNRFTGELHQPNSYSLIWMFPRSEKSTNKTAELLYPSLNRASAFGCITFSHFFFFGFIVSPDQERLVVNMHWNIWILVVLKL